MPPKVKVTRENIIDTAVELVRAGGIQTVNARDVAGVLQCSTQPIFSNFATMDELRQAVIEKAEDLFCVFMQQEAAKGIYPSYKASGMAYIRFAKEEKELFKLLYMRERNDDRSPLAIPRLADCFSRSLSGAYRFLLCNCYISIGQALQICGRNLVADKKKWSANQWFAPLFFFPRIPIPTVISEPGFYTLSQKSI